MTQKQLFTDVLQIKVFLSRGTLLKETPTQEICEILKNTFFNRTTLVAASDDKKNARSKMLRDIQIALIEIHFRNTYFK